MQEVYLCLDVGGTEIKAAPLDTQGNLLAEIRHFPAMAGGDKETLLESAARTKLIVTLEDNVLAGGFGTQIAAALSGSDTKVYSFGWPDRFIEHGSSEQLFKKYGLDAETIAERIVDIIES